MNIEELLIKLISFKTITGNFKEVCSCYDFIQDYLGDKFYYKKYKYNNYESLLISTNPDFNNFDILYNGHIDVVSAVDQEFIARIEDDKLFGRGSIDMKGQIACILHILKNTTLSKEIGFLITSDEEIGGHNGAEPISKEHPIKAKLAIIPDAGENFTFVDSEKALLQIDLVTTGISCHASVPHLGQNAIINAMNVYSELCKEFSLDTTKPINDNISINLSKITSGDLYNKVPDKAIWSIDIRHSGITKDFIESKLNQIASKYSTVYSIHNYVNEFRCDLDNKEIQNFIHVCENFLNKKLKHINENGASEIGYISNMGIPALSINPEGYNLHSDNEYVIISSLYKFQELLKSHLLS